MGKLFCGLDLGQASDYSALAIVEAFPSQIVQEIQGLDSELRVARPFKRTVEGHPISFHVRGLKRFLLGTSYPAIVESVHRTMYRLSEAVLTIDYTGVGRPVFDLFEARGLEPIAVSITGGEVVHGGGREWRIPKKDLVGCLVVAVQAQRLKVAKKLQAADWLLEELLAFHRSRSERTGHESFGAWREGIHDDLVLAVALAAWTASMWFTPSEEEVVAYEEDYHISTY